MMPGVQPQRPTRTSFRNGASAYAPSTGPSLSGHDIGDWEKSAYENYARLAQSGIRLVVMYYCAHHPRALLADFVQRIDRVYARRPATKGGPGTGTNIANFDVRKMRTLAEFAQEELELSSDLVCRAYESLLSKLKQEIRGL